MASSATGDGEKARVSILFVCMGNICRSPAAEAIFRAKAAQGRAEDLDTPDLPGVLQGIQIHDGPPHGSQLQRVAIIEDHAMKTWAVTASVVHPGIGMKDTEERARYGEALAGLLDVAGRTEKVDEILLMVRTVPEDGAEREALPASGLVPELNALVRSF